MSDTPKRSMFGRMFGGKAETSEKPSDTELAAAEPASIEAEEKAPEKTAPFGWFQRLRQGLTKTSSRLTDGITGVFVKRKLDDETLEELEDLLIQADLGIDVASSRHKCFAPIPL